MIFEDEYTTFILTRKKNKKIIVSIDWL